MTKAWLLHSVQTILPRTSPIKLSIRYHLQFAKDQFHFSAYVNINNTVGLDLDYLKIAWTLTQDDFVDNYIYTKQNRRKID